MHPAFEALPVALQRRTVASELQARGVAPNFELVELLRTQPGVPVMVAPGRIVQADKAGRIETASPQGLGFSDADTSVDLDIAGEVLWKDLRLQWRVHTRRPRTLRPKPGREWFDAERVGRWIHLRYWRAGDRYEPIGLGKSAKLQNLFTNLKVPAAQKRRFLLTTTPSGTIWWVQGLRIAEGFKVRPETTRFLEWRWEKVA